MTEEQLITALNNLEEAVNDSYGLFASLNDRVQDLEEDVERLCVAIEHWEAVNTARDVEGPSGPVEGAFTAAEAMGKGEGGDDLLGLLNDHYAGHEVPVELEEMNGKIYIEPQGFVGEDTFMELFGGNERVKYDSEAPQGKQNWIRREDVRGYIRETG